MHHCDYLSFVEILYDVIVESFLPLRTGLPWVLPLLFLHVGRPLQGVVGGETDGEKEEGWGGEGEGMRGEGGEGMGE